MGMGKTWVWVWVGALILMGLPMSFPNQDGPHQTQSDQKLDHPHQCKSSLILYWVLQLLLEIHTQIL